MKIAIIGAGFTGLAAADVLLHQSHEVTVFEKADVAGGLAAGFKDPGWDWSLEKHYHHLFTSDAFIRDLAAHIGHPLEFHRPATSTWVPQGIYRLDSPLHLLLFPGLPFLDRLRTGLVLGFFKLNPFWRPLEKITAEKFILAAMGRASWRVLWQPLLEHKFGRYSSRVSASWFWARIYKRSPVLGYPEGGFQSLAASLTGHLQTAGGRFIFNTGIEKITPVTDGLGLLTDSQKAFTFDRVICTLPSPLFTRICPALPAAYQNHLNSLSGVGAVNLVLALKKPFLPRHIYWLNVNVPGTPFLAVVEHTNFISSSHYSGRHLVYLGNYLPFAHPYFQKNPDQLLSEFLPALRRINPDFDPSWVVGSWVWKAPFAQPIVPINYSSALPSIATPVPHLFLANIQQVYPWDRGTNYAVELGQRAAKLCLTD